MSNLWPAFLAAKKEFKKIEKNAVVAFGKTSFRYADLEELFSKTKPALEKHGLIVVQDLSDGPQGERLITTTLIHAESGESHAATTRLCAANESAKEIGAAITYMRRYCYAAKLGLVADEDRDAEAASMQKEPEKTTITREQLDMLADELKNEEVLLDQVLDKYGIKKLADLKKSDFSACMARLRQVKDSRRG